MFCLAKLFLLQPLLHLSFLSETQRSYAVFPRLWETTKKKPWLPFSFYLLLIGLWSVNSSRINSEVYVSFRKMIENQTSVDIFFSLSLFFFLMYFGIIWIKDNLIGSWDRWEDFIGIRNRIYFFSSLSC